MKNFKPLLLTLSATCLLALFAYANKPVNTTTVPGNENENVVIAYVTSWKTSTPDPTYITHINYAFGHVNATFNGVRIDNEPRLKEIVTLKKKKPALKILLSIGGWGSGRFSEMAADENNRKSFAQDCQRVVDAFGLDGIDIDWEYPTSGLAKISASPEDTANFTLLMRDIRQAIGMDKLLTLATVGDAKYIDFRGIDPYVDFINIMSYDMGNPPYHHSGLYRSEFTERVSMDEGVKAHIAAGAPVEKLVLGIPFYGRMKSELRKELKGADYKNLITYSQFQRKWDDAAKAPYLVDKSGEYICGYDDAESIAAKCEYIIGNGMRGGMYWEYDGDDENGTLRKALFEGLHK